MQSNKHSDSGHNHSYLGRYKNQTAKSLGGKGYFAHASGKTTGTGTGKANLGTQLVLIGSSPYS